jgi:peptidoglycan/LPS O-acetylase OafA/YrhL
MMLVLLPLVWRRLSPKLIGLSIAIVSIVIANAFVTGTMSMVDERYGSRVIWLMPFLAGLLAMHWSFARRTRAQG